jgi:glyoxylase-like metal-dependent hydrolase (beta-lactamase superfamily II)
MAERKLTQVSPRVYAYVGTTNASPLTNSFGANAGVVIGRDCALVVDTLMSAKEGASWLADIRRLTDKPIRYVVNTHHHMDHTWGNCVFAACGAAIIAHDYTREALLQPANGLARAQRYNIPAADLEGTVITLPTITFSQELTVDLGDVTVRLSFPGASHTPGAITVYVVQDQVLFTGDILFTGYHATVIDGDIPDWRRVLEKLQEIPTSAIVPGHGPISSKQDLQALSEYLDVFDTEARRLCEGRTVADASAVAEELAKRLPEQGRSELSLIVRANLTVRYLAQAKA